MKVYVVDEKEESLSYYVDSVFTDLNRAIDYLENRAGTSFFRWNFFFGMYIFQIIRDGKKYTCTIVERELQ